MTGDAIVVPEAQALLRLRPVRDEKREAAIALVEPGGILVEDDPTPGRPVDGIRR